MDDLISRQTDCVLTEFGNCSYPETGCADCEIKARIRDALSVQPDHNADSGKKVERTDESSHNVSDSDLISRKMAIEALRECQTYLFDPHDLDKKISLESAEWAIEDLPSAQPEQHWIPCSKRLPEEREWIGTKTFGTTISDEVYVTFESPKGERFTKHLSFQNGKVSSFTQREIDVFYKGAVPIAWMPLPEPYQGGDA